MPTHKILKATDEEIAAAIRAAKKQARLPVPTQTTILKRLKIKAYRQQACMVSEVRDAFHVIQRGAKKQSVPIQRGAGT